MYFYEKRRTEDNSKVRSLRQFQDRQARNEMGGVQLESGVQEEVQISGGHAGFWLFGWMVGWLIGWLLLVMLVMVVFD